MVAEGDGIGARCVRKSSDVRGSPPKTGISGEGASPPKTGIYGEGTSPPKIASWAFIHFVLGVCNFARAKAMKGVSRKQTGNLFFYCLLTEAVRTLSRAGTVRS